MSEQGTDIISRIERFSLRFLRGSSFRTFLKGFYGLVTFLILLVIDLVAHSLKTIQGPTLDFVRALLQCASLYYWGRALAPLYFRHKDLSRRIGKPDASNVPVTGLRWFVIVLAAISALAFFPRLFNLLLTTTYEAKAPSTVVSIEIINAVWLAGASILIGSFVKLVTLWNFTREVNVRLFLWSGSIVLSSVYEYLFAKQIFPNDTVYDIIHQGLRSLIVFSTLFLWFRIQWIPHISSTAKNRILIYSAIGTVFSVVALFFYSIEQTEGLLHNYATITESILNGFFLSSGAYCILLFFNALFTLSSTELVERRQTEVQSLAKLTRFSSDVLTSELLLDIPRLADQITTLACEATQSDAAWLELKMQPVFGPEQSEEIYRSFDGITPEQAFDITQTALSKGSAQSLAEELSENQRPVLVNSSDSFPTYNGEPANSDRIALASLAVIPLMYKSQLRGALYVAKEKEYGFDEEDVTVLTAFSDIASLAFDTARLLTDSIEKQKFDGELRAARSMQQSLLPSNVPKIPEFEIDALSIPAYEVGGDYYDFSTLWNGKHLIVTGDVSGKGISASIFMAEVKGIIQALAPTMSSIRELLVAANDAVMRNVQKNATSRSFVTLAAISLEGPMVHYARAGHTPLLYFGANGDFRYLQPKGMGIGFVGRKLFERVLEEEEFILGKGETLVLFSDGITEVRNTDGEELGYQRLAEIIRAARFEDEVEKMKDRILKNVLDYSATTSFNDDATFVIIRRL